MHKSINKKGTFKVPFSYFLIKLFISSSNIFSLYLALSILTLTGAFKMLSAVNPERVLQAIVSFTTVMGMFSAALLAAGYAANKGFGFKAGLGVTLLVHSLTTIFLTLLAFSKLTYQVCRKV